MRLAGALLLSAAAVLAVIVVALSRLDRCSFGSVEGYCLPWTFKVPSVLAPEALYIMASAAALSGLAGCAALLMSNWSPPNLYVPRQRRRTRFLLLGGLLALAFAVAVRSFHAGWIPVP